MLASAVSICGVSAAIATSGAIHGDSKKLSYVISLVLITAIPMMLLMPWAAQGMGLSPEVTGAWLGGTIDTTGAVVASGTLAGEAALRISTIVKFSQNVLLGVAAFAISVYWTYTKNKSSEVQAVKPTEGVIWERFPKFILGFLAASLLFSFVLSAESVDAVKGSLKSL
ncbi:YeiH family protein [Spirosoma arcticum]